MDDSRIHKLRSEVLSQLDGPSAPAESSGLESRVAALEAAVAALQRGRAPAGAAALPVAVRSGYAHPSLQVIDLGPTGDRCVMEPDKPCVQSHACRTFGH